ncbi:MAG: hypothetical protein U1F87_10030 [Kiritimatiellia bacterium]
MQVEKVEYDDVAPWPAEADGLGPALERLVDTAYGNDPANWMARNAQGSPGGPHRRSIPTATRCPTTGSTPCSGP